MVHGLDMLYRMFMVVNTQKKLRGSKWIFETALPNISILYKNWKPLFGQ